MKFGVFDSGIGGVTVLQALRKQFPGETFLYFGDTANVPYGTKSPNQIRTLSVSAAQQIRSHGVEALIVACNTASSLALPEIERVLAGIPIYGMVEAGVRAVVRAVEKLPADAPVVVFGTRATVKSHIYGKMLGASLSGRQIEEQACPLLVPMIEEGWVSHPVLMQTLSEYVAPYRGLKPGVALLACTHYPWIRAAFEKALPGWSVVDSADAVASRLRDESAKLGLEPGGTGIAPVEWYFSDPEVANFIFEEGKLPEIRTFS